MRVAPNSGPLRVALVGWGGGIGGAELFTGNLACELRRQGADARVGFVLDGRPLSARLDALDVPNDALDLPRGRAVLRAPRRLARMVSALGPDVAILVEGGYLAAALRAGGYRGAIIGVEHGALLQEIRVGRLQRLGRAVARRLGSRACSAEVAVSEYVRDRLVRTRREPRVVCIPNGVDVELFRPGAHNGHRPGRELVVASASRLVDGKGIEDLIRAFAAARVSGARLRIAGEGEELPALESLATALGVRARTEFLGPLFDMPAFWQSADVAVVPSNGAVESFGMAAIEAMACGKPVVVSDSGALPEVVADGRTGRVVGAGNVAALADAIASYAQDPSLRGRHGREGRAVCEQSYRLESTASRYLALATDVVAK